MDARSFSGGRSGQDRNGRRWQGAVWPLLDLTAGQMRRAADGWHAVLRIGAVDHRVWSKEPPVLGASYAAQQPLLEQAEEIKSTMQKLSEQVQTAKTMPKKEQLPMYG